MPSKNRANADPDTEQLREALCTVHEKWGKAATSQKIMDFANALGMNVRLESNTLDKFRKHEQRTIAAHSVAALNQFFDTQLGRALLYTDKGGHSRINSFVAQMFQGKTTLPRDTHIEGLYFACHGSYIKQGHFAVRVLDIAAEGTTLVYRDFVKDNITGKKHDDRGPAGSQVPSFEARGIVTFFRDLPHLVATSNDNAVGFRLIVGSDVVAPSGGIITKITGQMLGMTERNQHFYRSIVLRRHDVSGHPREQQRNSMIRETGTFRLEDLPPHHRDAIYDLSTALPKQPHYDPILDIAPLQKLNLFPRDRLREEVPKLLDPLFADPDRKG